MLSFGEFVQLQESKYTIHFKKHGTENQQTATVSADTEDEAKSNFRKTHPDVSISSISKSPGLLHRLFGAPKDKKSKDSPHYKTNHHYGHGDIEPSSIPIFRSSWQHAR